jgi:hypothetical protein
VINNEAVVREDYLVGGDGYDDAVYIAGNPAQVSVDLSQGLTAGDGEGGSDRLWEIENALISNPSLIVSAGSDQVAAKGGSVVLNASVSWPGGFPPYQYRWEPADGLDDPTVLQPTASPERTTTYKLTVTDRFGAVDADFVTVKVVDALVVSAGPDRTISLGQSAQLEGEASGGVTPYTYVWTPSDGLSRTDVARPLASPNHDTTYTLTVTDGLGRSASDTVVVRVTSPFSISAGSDVSILPGGSAILNVTINGGAPPFAIHWTPATGLSADNVADPIAQPSATTAYTVRVTDALGREASDTLIVTVTLGSGTDTPGGGPDQPGGGQGPRTSPPGGDDETPPGAAPVGCGGGMAMALAVNALALLLLRRRRAD